MTVSIRGRQLILQRQAEVREMYDRILRQHKGNIISKNAIVAQISIKMGLSVGTIYKDLKTTAPKKKEEAIIN